MYKIIGADGKEYGPVSLEQLRAWVAQGRINGQTLVQPAGSLDWKPAGGIPELNALLSPPGPHSIAPPEPPLPTASATAAISAPQHKGLAITSFILGVVSFVFCLGVVTGIPAIICGHIARKRAREEPAQHGGTAFATAGVILGYVSLIYTLLIVALLIPNFYSNRKHAAAHACAGQLRQIGLAFRVWDVDHQDQFPFNVSTNAGGTMELCRRGPGGFDQNAVYHFAAISNELVTPKILVCPEDHSRRPASDFAHFSGNNVTYLLRTGPALKDSDPAEVLVECPIHGLLLHCDGSVEPKPLRR